MSSEEFSSRCRKPRMGLVLSPKKEKKYISSARQVIPRLTRNDTRCCHHLSSSSYAPNPRPRNHFSVASAISIRHFAGVEGPAWQASLDFFRYGSPVLTTAHWSAGPPNAARHGALLLVIRCQ